MALVRIGLRTLLRNQCLRTVTAANYSAFRRTKLTNHPAAQQLVLGKFPSTPAYSFHTTEYCCDFDEVDLRDEICLHHDKFISAVKNDEILVIDVRTPEEVEAGHVKAKRFVNIPVQELEEALKLPEDQFKMKYSIEKPVKDASDLVFHCKKGGRSTYALYVAEKAGYTKVKHYPGGWEEFESKA